MDGFPVLHGSLPILGHTLYFSSFGRDTVDVLCEAREAIGPLFWINEVPEPKTLKNRMHLDVVGDVRELLDLGATLVRAQDADIDWTILADPEGNEFCVFAPES